MKTHSVLSRAAAILLALAILLPCVPAFAAKVVNVACIDGTYYTSWEKAWSAAINSNKKTIDMLADWKTDDDLVVPNNVTVTLNMHGHMINRNNTKPDDIHYGSDWLGSGTVIRVTEGATLTVNGKSDDLESCAHTGRLINGTWYYNSKGGNIINGALITGGATDGVYSAISVDKKATLKMNDVTIAGNVSDTYITFNGFGGGVCISGVKTNVELNRCTISYNYAGGSGGGVSIDTVYSSTIKIRNSNICGNIADGCGGGIYIGENCEGLKLDLTGTKIEANTARKGGGIYISEEDVTVTGATVSSNTTSESGGGVYVNSTDCTLSKLTVTGNRATAQGGGIYIRQEDNTLSGCTVEQNSAKEGGGVYMSNSNYIYTPTLSLSGKVIIRNNTASNVSYNSDLLLADDKTGTIKITTNPAKIVYNLSEGSVIYVLCKNRVITYKSGSFNEGYFYADEPGKYVYWGQNKSNKDEYRQLVMSSGSREEETPVITLDPGSGENGTALKATDYTYSTLHPIEGPAETYTVYKGYSQDDGSSRDMLPFYYTDGYFLDDPTVYNTHLASLSLNLELSAFNSNTGKDTKGNKLGNTARFTRVKQMLADIGCDDEKTYIHESYLRTPTTDSIGFAIGQKKLQNSAGEDTGYILIPIAVRGGGYGKEWASNVTLGESGNHQGFYMAADQVMGALIQYIDDYDLELALVQGKLRFWVVGFSRGGATANLVAKQLIDRYASGDMKNAVYAYTFEAPQGGTGSEIDEDSDYSSIHNIINQSDVVPHVAMIAMNFMRYGVDHYVPGDDADTPVTFKRRYAGMLAYGSSKTKIDGSDANAVYTRDNNAWDTDTQQYAKQKKVMLEQLKALPGNVFFDDYFHLATPSLTSAVIDGEILSEIGYDDVTMANWLPDFIFYLNYWLAGTNARQYYVKTGYQSTLRKLMDLKEGTGFNISTAFSKVDGDTIKTLLGDLISGDLTPQSLYNVLRDAGVFDTDGIPLTYEEAYNTVSIIMQILKGDMTDVDDYPFGTTVKYGEDDYLVQTGTLLYNATNLLLNHNIYVIDAWLRSYDSYYLNDEEASGNRYKVRAATQDEVDAPYITFMYDGQEITLQQGETYSVRPDKAWSLEVYLHTSERNKGGAIYYSVTGDISNISETLYQKPIKLNATDGKSYARIDAHTLWYDTPSDTVSFGIVFDSKLHQIYIDDMPYAAYSAGDTAVVQTDLMRGDCVFSHWKYYSHATTDLPNLSVNNNVMTFTMPDADVRLGTTYITSTVAAPVSNLVNKETYADIRTATIGTPSGTVEEGFHTICEITAVYLNKSGQPEEHYTETDKPLVLTGSRESKVEYRITAYSTKEGWNDSEKVYFEYTIDYSLQCRVVTVINGLILDLWDEVGYYYPGDTVSVRAVTQGTVQTRSEDGELTSRADTDYHFDSWRCSDASITFEDPAAEEVSFVMPNDDVCIEAVMVSDTKYEVTVERGKAYNEAGDLITEAAAGETVYLRADDPATDEYGNPTETFTCWAGNVSTFRNRNAPETYFIMPTGSQLAGGIHIQAYFNGEYAIDVANGAAYDTQGEEITHAGGGDMVTLRALTDVPKYTFKCWSTTPELHIDDLSSPNVTFDMPYESVSAVALFAAQITVVNGYAVDADGNAITCALEGERITLVADAAPEGMMFSHWTIEDDSALQTRGTNTRTGARCAIDMPSYPIRVTAVYTQKLPETGDDEDVYIYLAIAFGALAILVILQRRRKRA